MKKMFWALVALLFVGLSAQAQQHKIKVANEDTAEWRYELQNEGAGDDATVLVCVYSYSKNVDVAREQCLKNAIHGLIFRGAPGKDSSVKTLAPLVPSAEAMQQHKAYFTQLFQDGGDYRRFATVASAGGVGGVVKQGKEYKVRVYVTVHYSDLRRSLEDAGIIEPMINVAEDIMPKIIVIPADEWCISNGYYTEVDRFGVQTKLPDYRKALQSDPLLLNVLVQIGGLMKERGFDLVLLEESLKRIETQAAEYAARSQDAIEAGTGVGIQKTNYERLRESVQADFWIKVNWHVTPLGPRAALDFMLQGVDAYSDKQIAASQCSCAPVMRSALDVPSQLRAEATANIEQFNRQLLETFLDIRKNGRVITLTCKVDGISEVNYDSEVNGAYLSDVVEDWVADNAFNGKYVLGSTSTNVMIFDEIRIPLKHAHNNRPVQVSRWIRGLRTHLLKDYSVPSKIDVQGKGTVTLLLGVE